MRVFRALLAGLWVGIGLPLCLYEAKAADTVDQTRRVTKLGKELDAAWIV